MIWLDIEPLKSFCLAFPVLGLQAFNAVSTFRVSVCVCVKINVIFIYVSLCVYMGVCEGQMRVLDTLEQ